MLFYMDVILFFPIEMGHKFSSKRSSCIQDVINDTALFSKFRNKFAADLYNVFQKV